MTTIAYRDGIIAYDSRCTRGDVISNEEHDKRVIVDGVAFFMAGAVSDRQHFIDGYLKKTTPPKEADGDGLIVDKGVVYRAGAGDGEFWFHKAHPIDAIGSGFRHALTAVDCGLSAKEAVEMAKKRDTGTGGRVRTHKVKH